MSLENIHLELLAKIESKLSDVLNKTIEAKLLLEAMRYSSLNGGKRIRPLLTIAVGMMCKADLDVLITVGCAIELMHCYSLIHDDLPAMDNDDLRRGKPTCHKQFNEAAAILAGDSLQSLAFELLSENDLTLDASTKLKIVNLVAKASGMVGMAGGQMIDLVSTGTKITKAALERMHTLKTGALIESSVLAGYLCGSGLNQTTYNGLSKISLQLGLLFQVIDDIIDVTGTTDVLGKTAHKDQYTNKATYVTVMGLKEAYAFAETLYVNIIKSLEKYQGSEFLLYLADLVYNRKQ